MKSYLEAEGHDIGLAELLFTGMVERVVALVSRVQGTYEFEVQPLREYFAARHLYETAPYSPAGREKRGTKPERFSAIARNFYWLNVARFYAGCYSKGELESLIDGFDGLLNEEDYRLISHPREFAAMLLADWVFCQQPKSVEVVLDLLLRDSGLRLLLGSRSRGHGVDAGVILPEPCGRRRLVEYAFGELKITRDSQYRTALANLIVANASEEQIRDDWMETCVRTNGEERTGWLQTGLLLGALNEMDESTVRELVLDDGDSISIGRLRLLYRARLFGPILESETSISLTAREVVDFPSYVAPEEKCHPLEALGLLMDPDRYALAFTADSVGPLRREWRRFWGFEFNDERVEDMRREGARQAAGSATMKMVCEFVDEALATSEKSTIEWAQLLAPWHAIVGKVQEHWKGAAGGIVLANLAAAVELDDEPIAGENLLDDSTPLCTRTHYARLKADDQEWWRHQLNGVNESNEMMLVLFTGLTWASEETLVELRDGFKELIDALPSGYLARLGVGLDQLAFSMFHFGPRRTIREKSSWKGALPMRLHRHGWERGSPKMLGLLAHRFKDGEFGALYDAVFTGDDHADSFCWQAASRAAIARLSQPDPNWEHILHTIKAAHALGVAPYASDPLPLPVATAVLSDPGSYPMSFVYQAEQQFKASLASRMRSVSEIAEEGGWFEQT